MADNLRKFTTQEVLNKVYSDSSGNSIGINAATSKETLNAALDTSNSRLNVSLAGGTISGDVTITGDLTVNGSATNSYDEIVNGQLVTFRDDASTVGTNDNIVIENDGAGDASLKFSLTGATDWFAYIDNSDSDKFKIRRSTTDHFTIDESGNATFGGTLASVTAITDGIGLNIESNSLTTGNVGRFYSDSSNTSARNLVEITNDHTGASGTTALRVRQDAAHTAIDIDAANTGDWAVDIQGTAHTTAGLLYNYSNSSDTGTRNLVEIHNDHASATGTTALKIIQDSSNSALTITSGNYSQLQMISSGAENGIKFVDSGGTVDGYIYATDSSVGFLNGSGSYTFKVDANSRISLGNNDSSGNIYNTIFGYLAGNSVASGATSNTLIGYASGDAITTGTQNTAVGESALSGTDNGASNTAIGNSAMGVGNADTANTAVGSQSMIDVTGSYNTAVGMQSLFDITSGGSNVAIGALSLKFANAGEDNNISIGVESMRDVIENGNDASKNIAIGSLALTGGTLGADFTGNIAIGDRAMDATNTNGSVGQIAIGQNALSSLTSSEKNVAIGYESQLYQTDGTNNVSLGYKALRGADNGESGNVVIGSEAGISINHASSDGNVIIGATAGTGGAAAMTGVVVIGQHAMSSTAGNAQTGTIAIGNTALWKNTTGQRNNALGFQSLAQNTTGDDNIAIGYQSLTASAESQAHRNIAIGNYALSTLNARGQENIAIGFEALQTANDADIDANIAIGNYVLDDVGGAGVWACVGLGHNALTAVNNGGAVGSTAIGYYSLSSLTSGSGNTSVGFQALKTISSGTFSTAVGYEALELATGNSNTGIGYYAGTALTSGFQNTMVGTYAGYSSLLPDNTVCVGYNAAGSGAMTAAADGTVAIGSSALSVLTSGAGNTAVGYQAGDALTVGGENVILGSSALGAEIEGTSNTAIGYDALKIANAGGSNGAGTTTGNTALGTQAGNALTTGKFNTFLGAGTDASANSGENQTTIGFGAIGVADNSVTLGNADVTANYLRENITLKARNDQPAIIELQADNADNNADNWQITSSTDGFFKIKSKDSGSFADYLTIGGSNALASFTGKVNTAGVVTERIENSTNKFYELNGSKAVSDGVTTDLLYVDHSNNYSITLWCFSANASQGQYWGHMQTVYGASTATETLQKINGSLTNITVTYQNSNRALRVKVDGVDATVYYHISGMGNSQPYEL